MTVGETPKDHPSNIDRSREGIACGRFGCRLSQHSAAQLRAHLLVWARLDCTCSARLASRMLSCDVARNNGCARSGDFLTVKATANQNLAYVNYYINEWLQALEIIAWSRDRRLLGFITGRVNFTSIGLTLAGRPQSSGGVPRNIREPSAYRKYSGEAPLPKKSSRPASRQRRRRRGGRGQSGPAV